MENVTQPLFNGNSTTSTVTFKFHAQISELHKILLAIVKLKGGDLS